MAVERVGVLLLAHGSPESVEQMEQYLLHIRGGRPTPAALVDEMKRRYTLVGGRSPLLDITRAQARALQERLNDGGEKEYRTYVGMRHWNPFIEETMAEMLQDGVKQAVAVCMAPQFSQLSVGAYFQKVREALEPTGNTISFRYVSSWHDNPFFIRAVAEKLISARERMGTADDLRVIFTAHSLPASVLEQGDPYDAQVHETARLVAAQVGLDQSDWQFCYQSAGATSVPWLGPALNDVVSRLGESGIRKVLVVPVGFVADHVEILYDIDVEARGAAEKAGVHLERTESLNVSPSFIEALADVVRGVLEVAPCG